MHKQQIGGRQLSLLWLVIVAAFAVALRRGSLVPWGAEAGPGLVGAPFWAFVPLGIVLVVTVVLTTKWWHDHHVGEPK